MANKYIKIFFIIDGAGNANAPSSKKNKADVTKTILVLFSAQKSRNNFNIFIFCQSDLRYRDLSLASRNKLLELPE